MGQLFFLRTAIVLSLLPSIYLSAAPINPSVITGNASFHLEGQTVAIDASNRTILDWKEFSIQSGESVVFTLPQSDSAILNRVTGGSLSEIHGALLSNGAVYLINPQGIWIGPEGRVQTAAFLASTLDCSNEEFVEGGELRFFERTPASLVNEGAIESAEGDLVLLARTIENRGSADSLQGQTVLGAGQEIVYCPYGDGRIQVVLQEASSDPENYGIDQSGSLFGKSIEMTADGNLYAYAISCSGAIEAEERAVLMAEEGFIDHSGSLRATEAHVLGSRIYLKEGSLIDVSGDANGGTALIGGDYQGLSSEFFNAKAVVVDKGAAIYADAGVKGDGGKIIVWSDEATGFYGNAFARGGSEGGDGGFIEVSSKGAYDFSGTANLLAPFGNNGTLLLDPTDITISSSPSDAGITFGAGCGANTYCNTGVLSPRNILNSDITMNLGLGNVIIASTPGGPGGGTGDISFTTAFSWMGTTTNTLTLNARRNINFSAGFSNTTTAGNVICNAGLGAAGTITIASGVTVAHSSAGDFQLLANTTAASTITITGALNVTGGNLTITTNNTFTLTAGTGSITYDSAGNTFNFSSTVTGAGACAFNGSVAIDNGDISWTTAGTRPLSIASTFSTLGTGTISITPGGALSTGAASTFTHGSSGLCTFQSTAAGVTIAGPMTQSATGGNLAISGTTVALNAALANNSTSGSTLSLTSTGTTLTSNASGTITTATTAGGLTIMAGTTATFGAAVTHNSLAGNFTCNANTSIALNANYSNSSIGATGTTNFTAGLTAAGVLTIGPVGGGTTFTHTSTGDCNLVSNATAGADITFNSPVSVTGANLTMTLNDDFTMNATSGITYDAAGKTFTFASTAAAGSVATFGAAVAITDGNVSWTTAGTGTLALNNAFTTAGTGTISIVSGGALTKGATGAFSHASTGTCTFQSTGAATTVSSTLTQTATGGSLSVLGGTSVALNAAVANNSTSGSTLTVTAATTTITAAAAATITTASTAGALSFSAGTTATFNGAITHNSAAGNFTCDANTSIAFNADVQNLSLTGTTSVNAGMVNAGALTIGPGGGGTVFTHTSSGDCNLLSSPTAGSDITMNSPLTVTGANLTMTLVDDFTMNATSGITFTSPGDTFSFHTTALAGTVATFSGAVSANGIVDFQVDGGTLAINAGFTTSGSDTASFSATTSITCGAASIFMHNSTGDLSFISPAGDLTFNGSLTIPSSNATFSPSDDFTLGAAGTIAFSAAGKLLDFQTGPSSTYTFTGAVTVTGGNMTVDANDDIIISAATGSISYNVVGGMLDFTSTGGADPDFVMNGTLNVQNGTLLISTFDDITFAAGSTFTYASTDPLSLTASGTTGAINWNGTSTVSNGTLTMNAQTDIAFGVGGLTTYTSPNLWTLTATTGTIDIDGTIALTTAAAWNATCGANFSVQGLARNFSTGAMTVSCGNSFILGGIAIATPAQFGSAGGMTQVTAGADLNIDSSQTTAGATAFLGFSFGGQTAPMSISVGGNATIDAGQNEDAAIFSTDTLSMTVGGNLSLGTDAAIGLTGDAYIQGADTTSITANNISLAGFTGGGAAYIKVLGGKGTIIANVTTSVVQNSYVQNAGSGNLVLVVDEQAPAAPAVGNGMFILGNTATLSTSGGELSIFTVSPDQNDITGLINGATLAQGNHVFGVYYSSSAIDPPPFTIFYKGGGVALSDFNRINIAVAEMLATGFERTLGWDITMNFWPRTLFADEEDEYFLLNRKSFEYPVNFRP